MKSIHSLIPDIYSLIKRKDGWFTDVIGQGLSLDIAQRLGQQLGAPEREPRLRLSQMGPRCPCALWYSIHRPELAETLPPWAEIKYSFGHILEGLAIALAKAAGHHVVGEQDVLELDGVLGHRDCVIDGCTVDVKSASSVGFQKFKLKDYSLVDSFGYLDQLDGYVVAAATDPLVQVKDKGYILAIDKTLGHMYLYEHQVRLASIRERIETSKRIVELNEAPACTCRTQSDGASGNIKLAFPATYNSFKYCCKPGLRTFLYEEGPRYLTKVMRRPAPHIREIDRYGNTIYS